MDFTNLKLDDLLIALAAILAVIPGLMALWQNRKKSERDVARTDAETENIHADIADKYAKREVELLKRLEILERNQVDYRVRIEKIERKVAEWQAYAERLESLIIELGHKSRLEMLRKPHTA